MMRRLFAIASVLSLLLCVGVWRLWVRSASKTDVCMIPTGHGTALLFKSNWGGWGELTVVSDWPQPRLGRWSGDGWRNVGPLLIWTHLPGTTGTTRVWGGFWDSAGSVMVPRAGPGQAVAYEHSYDRAVALGYPQTLAPPPETLIATARQLKFPFGRSMLVLAVLPAMYALLLGRRGWVRIRRARRERREGLRLCRS